MNKNDRLIRSHDNFQENLRPIFELTIQKDSSKISNALGTLVNSFKSKGLYEYFINKSVVRAKQAWYTAARLMIYKCKTCNSCTFLFRGLEEMTFALLSDNKEVIEEFVNIGFENDDAHQLNSSLVFATQSIILDDYDRLETQIELIKKYLYSAKYWKRFAPMYVDYFRGMHNRDTKAIEKILYTLDDPKVYEKRTDSDDLRSQFLSVPTLLFAKIAWMKGIEVTVDSPLVPKDLLPVKPNDHYYDEYEFLKELDDDTQKPVKQKVEVLYKEEGPYPEQNPTLRSDFVNPMTVSRVVQHFCPNHSQRDRDELTAFIWEAYTDPMHFDLKHADYVRKNASWPLETTPDKIVKEARPFWSELSAYDDEGYFRYCNHFIIMNEMNITPDEVETYLDELKGEVSKL